MIGIGPWVPRRLIQARGPINPLAQGFSICAGIWWTVFGYRLPLTLPRLCPQAVCRASQVPTTSWHGLNRPWALLTTLVVFFF